jgi:hypothetical protein
MRHLWMGITPGPDVTRVLVQDGPDQTLLKARLPHSPRHPRALLTLGEALALWVGRPVRAAIAADGPGAFCATTPWLETFDLLTQSPLVEVDFVAHARPPRERDGLDGLGDFRAVRQLILRTVPR